MALTCVYCSSQCEEGSARCANCGAPISHADAAAVDYRSCPYCHRKLLALASPACNYCGRRLPDEYIKAREADLKRLTDMTEENRKVSNEEDGENYLTRRLKRKKRSSKLDLLDLGIIVDLTDLFS